ncbi:hypothetical protein ACHAXN_002171 [Cyclotella atomus]
MKSSLSSSLSRSDSITSQNELLTMSYARKASQPSIGDESCTEEEKEQIATLPKSTFSSFVSPAERKKRQMAKLEAMKTERPKEAAVIHAEVADVFPLTVATKNDPEDEDSSDDESSSSDTTSLISNVNSSSPKSGGEKNLDSVPEYDAKPAPTSNPDASFPEVLVPAGEDEDYSEIPLESDVQKRKRNAIQGVMRDTSLSQVEKNKRIQDIIAGRVDLENLHTAPPPQAPQGSEVATQSVQVALATREVVETAGADEHASEIPLESDLQKRKRAAIQAVMRDSSLSQTERNTKIQDIIGGKVDLGDVKLEPTPVLEAEVGDAPKVEITPAIEGVETSMVSEPQETEITARSTEVNTVALETASPSVSETKPHPPIVAPVEMESQTMSRNASSSADNVKEQPAATPSEDTSDDLDLSYQRNIRKGLELKAQQQQREISLINRVDEQQKSQGVTFASAISYESELYDQKQKELEIQLEQKRREMELQIKTMEMELQKQLELEMARQRRLELEQQQREIEFQSEQRRLREEAETRRQAERHRLELERMRDMERQQSIRQMRQERERQMQEELDRQRQLDMSRSFLGSSDRAAPGSSEQTSSLSAVAAAKTLMSRMNYFRPPRSNQPRTSRYDGVDDDELNWRLDCYASLSDFTIVVHRALPGPFAPDFDVADFNLIDVELGSDGSPVVDVYYVHRVMLAVGGARSELLGRRIRDAEVAAENSMEGGLAGSNVHETILLEIAADAFPTVLDFCYFPDQPVDMNVNNAVPLIYLAQRYKIRSLLEKAEAFVIANLESANAVHFLLNAYLFKFDDILRRAIDVTAAHFDDRVDFEPIYKLPTQLFRRIIASTRLKCESELLSLVVYSYCGEHHSNEVDVEYFREVTRPKLMPDIDSKVALMMLKFYVKLLTEENAARDVMEVLQEDNLTNRCINVIAKNWRHEICEPLMVDAEWDESAAASRRYLPPHEPASLHRSLPSQLQNRVLERCLLVAMDDTQVRQEKPVVQIVEREIVIPESKVSDNEEKNQAIIGSLRAELDESKKQLSTEKDKTVKELEELRQKVADLEAEVKKKSKSLEQYKHELKRFRRVPGIHSFGSVSKNEPTIIDKTMCTYSANPSHHYPNHRRGNKPPTQMPQLASEFQNLGRENGYLYNDGHGELLPVFYYSGDR